MKDKKINILSELKNMNSAELGLVYVMLIHNTTQMKLKFSGRGPIKISNNKKFKDKVIFWIMDQNASDDKIIEAIKMSKKRIKEEIESRKEGTDHYLYKIMEKIEKIMDTVSSENRVGAAMSIIQEVVMSSADNFYEAIGMLEEAKEGYRLSWLDAMDDEEENKEDEN